MSPQLLNRCPTGLHLLTAGRLTKVGKAFYLFTMPGQTFPDGPVLTNSAQSYLRRADFLISSNLAQIIEL